MQFSSRSRRLKGLLAPLAGRLADLHGPPVEIRLLDDPRLWRGRLLAGDARGRPVYAGSFLRKRLVVLDRALLDSPPELTRIVLHEVCHFAWLRLGNPARREWETLLAAEMRGGVGGELGWSAEMRKLALAPSQLRHRTRRWREYVCESFCDTGAWMLGGGRHPEHTLPAAARRLRRRWFGNLFGRPASI